MNKQHNQASNASSMQGPLPLIDVECALETRSVDNHQLPPSLFDRAGVFNRLFFVWMNGIMSTGTRKTLEATDLEQLLPSSDRAENVYGSLRAEWEVEKARAAGKAGMAPSLFRAIVRAFGWDFLAFGPLIGMEAGVELAAAIFLGAFVESLSDGSSNNKWIYGTIILLFIAAKALLHAHYFFYAWRFGLRLRVATSMALFDKAMALQMSALHRVTVGYVTNLASNDIERFQKVGTFMHMLWIGPTVAVVVLGLLWAEIGTAAIAGCSLLVILIPVQMGFSRSFASTRKRTAKVTDSRIKATAQVIQGAALVKMSAWEGPFSNLIERLREKEVRLVFKANMLRAANAGIYFATSAFSTCAAMVVHHRQGHLITLRKVFVCISLFNVFMSYVSLFFISAIEACAEGYISLHRLTDYLLLDERSGTDKKDKIQGLRPTISLDNVSCSWDDEKPTLKNVSITLQHPAIEQKNASRSTSPAKSETEAGPLVAVIGAVGSGKSSLLQVLMRELELGVAESAGTMSVTGTIGYLSQEPWIMTGSLKENVLFGEAFDANWLDQVLDACALRPDIALLPQGIETMLGERGVMLSGGQRARVGFARVCYANKDVVLLDDPMSAVDTQVGRYLFEHCVCGLLRSKLRVLVTHQLQYIKGNCLVLVMDDGQLVAKGTCDELMAMHPRPTILNGLMREKEETKETSDASVKVPAAVTESSNEESKKGADGAYDKLIKEEDRETGVVSLATYWQWFEAGGPVVMWLLLLSLVLGTQALLLYSFSYLSVWAELKTIEEQRKDDQVWYYTGMVGGLVVASFARAATFYAAATAAARNLHRAMLACVLRAKILFFESNPSGRVLNRFSKDLGFVDDLLPWTTYDCVNCVTTCLGTVVLACTVNPFVVIVLVPLVYLFIRLRQYYLKSGREIKRLEAVSRSPIFSCLAEAVAGLVTIRAYGQSQRFFAAFTDYLDTNTTAYFAYLGSARWLAIRLEALNLSFLAVGIYGTLLVLEYNAESINPGMVALSVAYLMQLSGLLQWTVRQSAEVENQMVSVERILAYSRLDSDPALETDAVHKPPTEWPTKGEVTFVNFSLRYRKALPLVLKQVTLTIPGGANVGFAGRTGSGKTSLVQSLFRLVEAVDDGGYISIDGVRIDTIGLHDLRMKIAVIPQVPMLFAGTVRSNLDPFQRFNDEQVWAALKKVQMDHVVSSKMPSSLQSDIRESGTNLSVGEKQLLCLARAILRRSRVLVMDEATANIDLTTDALIQTAIRSAFRECTVLMVAHRLETIIDAQMVVVLSDGRVVESGRPHDLLTKKDGAFSDLVRETGSQTEAKLRALAAAASTTGA